MSSLKSVDLFHVVALYLHNTVKTGANILVERSVFCFNWGKHFFPHQALLSFLTSFLSCLLDLFTHAVELGVQLRGKYSMGCVLQTACSVPDHLVWERRGQRYNKCHETQKNCFECACEGFFNSFLFKRMPDVTKDKSGPLPWLCNTVLFIFIFDLLSSSSSLM